MAFIFGSFAKGREMEESDFDVGVYFEPDKLSENERFKLEGKIWSEISDIIKENIHLICLNVAPASLITEVVSAGIPLVIKDEKLYWEVYLKNSTEAEDFWYFAKDFYKIAKTAKSLSKAQKTKILERLHFVNTEVREIEGFKKMTFDEYSEDKFKRRNIERWTKNITNALIDISKIVLASENKPIPKGYKEALQDFGYLVGFNQKEGEKFSKFADLRNILAHQYLDILYKKIQEFIKEFPPLYKKISQFLEKYLSCE